MGGRVVIAYRGMHSVGLPLPDEALATFFAAWSPAPKHVERVPLELAGGRVLAHDVRAAADVPECPRSAMDGFAVRAADLISARADEPVCLQHDGEARAGFRSTLTARTAVRVATGAPLPLGADAVVRVEDAELDANSVRFSRAVDFGTDVVAAGEDISAGAPVACAGAPISAALLGVLATLGEQHVDVYRRPSVALISTGDEVVPIGTLPRAGEVRNSNAVALAQVLRDLGAGTITTTHVRDELGALHRALTEALKTHDAVVLTGGTSVGVRDFTTAALGTLPPPGVIVHGVRMTPGRPTVLALSGARPILGLPGSPTAAMLALTVLGGPIFAALCGRNTPAAGILGIAAEAFTGKPGWVTYVPVRIGSDGGVRPVRHHRSSFVSSLAAADGYVRLEPDRAAVSAGDRLEVHRLA
ncbi:MAG: molybdopterin molybdotransferase MoeA [Candidatus Eremiobacteraeota bacterium]|nr:molybdopterin molybdotransferase MoeA [Candidatus Eremiobacteraeota bacterium]